MVLVSIVSKATIRNYFSKIELIFKHPYAISTTEILQTKIAYTTARHSRSVVE